MYRSVRWLCLAGVVFCVVARASAADPVAEVDNIAAAKSLRNLGAVVRTDEQGFVREVSFAYSKSEEDVTVGLQGLQKIEVLDLSGMKVNDENLKNLKALVNVELLVLARTQVTDAGLEQIAAMTKLGGLDLSGTGVTGPGLVHITKLENLSDLLLDRTEIKDEHLEIIAKLHSLTSLSLIGTKQITSKGLTKLRRAAPKVIVVR